MRTTGDLQVAGLSWLRNAKQRHLVVKLRRAQFLAMCRWFMLVHESQGAGWTKERVWRWEGLGARSRMYHNTEVRCRRSNVVVHLMAYEQGWLTFAAIIKPGRESHSHCIESGLVNPSFAESTELWQGDLARYLFTALFATVSEILVLI